MCARTLVQRQEPEGEPADAALQLDGRGLALQLATMDLFSWLRPGTPPGRFAPEDFAHVRLVGDLFQSDGSGGLRGAAEFVIDSDQAAPYGEESRVRVTLHSSHPGWFTGSIGDSAMTGAFTLQLRYAGPGAERGAGEQYAALQALTFASQANQYSAPLTGALNQTSFSAPEGDTPGFDLRGSTPLGSYWASTSSTERLGHPLTGARAPFAIDYGASGVVSAPFSLAPVPGYLTGLGATRGSYGATSGWTASAIVQPPSDAPSTDDGSSIWPGVLALLPVYTELSYVHRVGDGADIGVRLFANPTLQDVLGWPPRAAASPVSAPPPNDVTGSAGTPQPEPPREMIGVRVFGSF